MASETDVFINGRHAIYKDSGAQLVTPDDVCLTPNGSGSDVPVTYTSIATSDDADKCAGETLIGGKPVCNTDSIFSKSTGAEAGTSGGVVSGEVNEKAEFVSGSPDTNIEGKPGVRHGDLMTNNAGNTAPAQVTQPGSPPIPANIKELAAEAAEAEKLPDRFVAAVLGETPDGLKDGILYLEDTPETDDIPAWREALAGGRGMPLALDAWRYPEHRACLVAATAPNATAFLELPGKSSSICIPLGAAESQPRVEAAENAGDAEAANLQLMAVVPMVRDEVSDECLPLQESRRLYVFLDGHLWREIEVDQNGLCCDVDLAEHAGLNQRPATGKGQPWLVLPARIEGRRPEIEMAVSAVPWSWGRIMAMGGLSNDDYRRLAQQGRPSTVNDVPDGRDRAWRCQLCDMDRLVGEDAVDADTASVGHVSVADLPPIEDEDLVERDEDGEAIADPLTDLRQSGIRALLLSDPLYQAERRHIGMLRNLEIQTGIEEARQRGEYGLASAIDIFRHSDPNLSKHISSSVVDQKLAAWEAFEGRQQEAIAASEKNLVDYLSSKDFERALSDFMDETLSTRKAAGIARFAAFVSEVRVTSEAQALAARLADGQWPMLEAIMDPDPELADHLGRMETGSWWTLTPKAEVVYATGLRKSEAELLLDGPVSNLAQVMSEHWIRTESNGLETTVAFAHRFVNTGAQVRPVLSRELIRREFQSPSNRSGVVLHPSLHAANAPNFEIHRIEYEGNSNRQGLNPSQRRRLQRLVRVLVVFEAANAMYSAAYLVGNGEHRDAEATVHIAGLFAASMAATDFLLGLKLNKLDSRYQVVESRAGHADDLTQRSPNRATRAWSHSVAIRLGERRDILWGRMRMLEKGRQVVRFLGSVASVAGIGLDMLEVRRQSLQGNRAATESAAVSLVGSAMMAVALFAPGPQSLPLLLIGGALSMAGFVGVLMSQHTELEQLLRHGWFGLKPYAVNDVDGLSKPEAVLPILEPPREVPDQCARLDFEAELELLYTELCGGRVVISRRRERAGVNSSTEARGYFDVQYIPGLFLPGKSRLNVWVEVFHRKNAWWRPGGDVVTEMVADDWLSRSLVARPYWRGRQNNGPLEALRMPVPLSMTDVESAECRVSVHLDVFGDERLVVRTEASCTSGEVNGSIARSDFQVWSEDWAALRRPVNELQEES